MAKATKRVKGNVSEQSAHPYVLWEGTALWKAIEKAVADLVENKDLTEKAHRDYIIGYICKMVDRRKSAITAQFSALRG